MGIWSVLGSRALDDRGGTAGSQGCPKVDYDREFGQTLCILPDVKVKRGIISTRANQ